MAWPRSSVRLGSRKSGKRLRLEGFCPDLWTHFQVNEGWLKKLYNSACTNKLIIENRVIDAALGVIHPCPATLQTNSPRSAWETSVGTNVSCISSPVWPKIRPEAWSPLARVKRKSKRVCACFITSIFRWNNSLPPIVRRRSCEPAISTPMRRCSSFKIIEVWFNLREEGSICLERITQTEPPQAALLHQLGWALPAQPPPKIYEHQLNLCGRPDAEN